MIGTIIVGPSSTRVDLKSMRRGHNGEPPHVSQPDPLWNIDYVRLLYWNKFGTPPAVLSKYGDEGAAYLYWWIDEDSAADLEDAIAKGKHLPATSPEVAFDAEFRP